MIDQDDSFKIDLPKFDISVYGKSDEVGSNPNAILRNAEISQGEKVADFGCGVGYFVMEASRIVGVSGRIFAIDISKDILDALKRKAIDSGRRNIYGIKADLEKPSSTGLDNESVDVVLIINVLYLVQKKETVLKEARRILKKGGKLVIMDWDEKGKLLMIEDDQVVGAKEIKELMRKLEFKKMKSFKAGLAHEVGVYTKL